MTNPFTELRAAREAQGISLEEIAQKTMISIDVLRALEAGNTSGLPAAYVRAFLREYAERVGLDPNIVTATLRAVVSALNRGIAQGMLAQPTVKSVSFA